MAVVVSVDFCLSCGELGRVCPCGYCQRHCENNHWEEKKCDES